MTSEEIIIPNCQGCSEAIEEGAVVAFGDSLFHVKCFICAKCKECVDNKTNLLLLDDGRPVCDNCSYNCAACHKVIRDEAIMTGDKAYHSDCFKCILCKKTIDDLIFTQTSKGIYCTKCHDLRKAEKSRRKNKQTSELTATNANTPQLQQPSQVRPEAHNNSSSLPPLPTPARSRSNSLKISTNISTTTVSNSSNMTLSESTSSKNNESILTDLSSFSFFDNDSNELANLSSSLGINFNIDTNDNNKSALKTTQSRINRASEILQMSLRTSSLKNIVSINEPSKDTSDVNKLQQELAESRSRIKELETSYKTLQDASQQALTEFSKVKEDFAKESNAQQQQELVILSLLKKNGGALSRKEIDRVAQLRIELEHQCKEMINYRDKMAAAMDEKAKKQDASAFYSNYQKNFQTQIKSLTSERDLLQHQTKDLKKTRDEVMHEMVLLNTKNAELTTMNNDLLRRATEKEETVVTVTSPQRHTPPPLSPSQSTDSSSLSVRSRPRKLSDASSIMVQVSSRNSFIKDQTPKLFSIKKKGSTMFSKFGVSSSSSSSSAKPKPEPSLSSSSLSVYGSSKSSIYSNNNFNSSLQSLHHDNGNTSSTLGRAFAKNNKSFMDSTASLQHIPSRHENATPTGTSNHSFQPMSFLRPVKCGACGDKIWGRSEYRCECCGFSSHSRCLSKVPQHCLAATSSNLDLDSSSSSVLNLSLYDSKPLPPTKKSSDGSMFGSGLSERVQMENRPVPLIVEECIKAVESRGLDYEGIYRKSGGAAQIRAIQLAFDQGEKIDLNDEEEYNDVCSITSVLKQYFRELPNPLLTFEVYDTFVNISSMNPDEKKTQAFKDTLSKLPKAHLDTIALLLQHLAKVYQRCDENRMTVKNLAMVFAPTLMRHSDPSRDFLDISYKNATIEYLLLHTSTLFTSS